jgi:hypothetical protein
MVERAAVEAKLAFRLIITCCATPVVLRWPTKPHTRALQASLGHRNIQHTVRSTELSPGRFKNLALARDITNRLPSLSLW